LFRQLWAWPQNSNTYPTTSFARYRPNLERACHNIHYNRGAHEIAYFRNIQKATFYSDTLADRGDGLTQMRASVEKSLESVEILKKHELGVFRPGAVNVENFGK
jgi:hypothetical protein